MIIKSTENLLSHALDREQIPAKSGDANESSGCEMISNEEAASILRSIFKSSCAQDFNAAFKAQEKAASVKFMITTQDEKDLRDLGYSQTQIDKIRPQEAADILKAGCAKVNPTE